MPRYYASSLAGIINAIMGAIFCHISKESLITTRPISPQYISTIIKSVAKACLPQAEYYSAHSLCRGFVTTTTQKGASFSAIMRQGHWRHEGAVQGYIEEGQCFNANAASSILDTLVD